MGKIGLFLTGIVNALFTQASGAAEHAQVR
jgi:hypothetical protein